MGDRKPQKGGRARVTFEAEYEGEGRDGQPARVKVVKGGMPALVSVADGSVFEVLEFADDPKVGEVRREDHNGGHSVWQVEENEDGHRFWRCTHSTAPGNRGATLPLPNDYAWPVIGAVPGTPAAEQTVTANQVEQWETDDLELAIDPHEPVVLTRAASAPPRVFKSDGPEPPADVKALEWLDLAETADQYPYVIRVGYGWLWSTSATHLKSLGQHGAFVPATPRAWAEAVRGNDGRYREVQP